MIADLDLPVDHDMPSSRRYPAPPTGHDLMALFPPAPPLNPSSGPTSGYFKQQERAFFAKRGKEIVRVQIEVDVPRRSEADDPRSKSRQSGAGAPRQWPPHAIPSQSPDHRPSSSMAPPPPPVPHPRGPRGVAVIPVFAAPQPPPPSQLHVNHPPPIDMQPIVYPVRPPQDPHAGTEEKSTETYPDDYRDETDDSWRRPMPHNERRRAGKHTKRVIVK